MNDKQVNNWTSILDCSHLLRVPIPMRPQRSQSQTAANGFFPTPSVQSPLEGLKAPPVVGMNAEINWPNAIDPVLLYTLLVQQSMLETWSRAAQINIHPALLAASGRSLLQSPGDLFPAASDPHKYKPREAPVLPQSSNCSATLDPLPQGGGGAFPVMQTVAIDNLPSVKQHGQSFTVDTLAALCDKEPISVCAGAVDLSFLHDKKSTSTADSSTSQSHIYEEEEDEMPHEQGAAGSSYEGGDGVTSTSSRRQRNVGFQAGTIAYTYEAFFKSDGRSRRRNELELHNNQVTSTTPSNAAYTTPAAAAAPVMLPGTLSNSHHSSAPCSRTAVLEAITTPAPSEKRFRCNECGRDYATSSNLSRHKQIHRSPDSQAAKSCPDCGKKYVSMPALAMHMKTHSMKFECNICGQRFARDWLLAGHKRTHTGEKPYGCAHCLKAFADRSNLRAHMQTHSEAKRFECALCGKRFNLKAYLNKHMESAHNITGSSSIHEDSNNAFPAQQPHHRDTPGM